MQRARTQIGPCGGGSLWTVTFSPAAALGEVRALFLPQAEEAGERK